MPVSRQAPREPDAPSPGVDPNLLAGGGYARKQLFSSSRLVAFSHGARFRSARRLVAPFAGGHLLDYGCGDGTFLVLVRDLFPHAVGADVDPAQTSDCLERLGATTGLTFRLTEQLRGADHEGAYDVVTCMETLEHCPAAERATVLRDLRRLVTPGGRVVISVPVEIGPSLVGKHLFRMVAARWLGDYAYPETYRAGELVTMLFAGEQTAIERPLYETRFPRGTVRYHGHKGFNWRALRAEVQQRFTLERQLFSPIWWLGPVLNSQVWLVCRPA